MKKLILSLVIVIVVALIGLGWLVSRLYFQLEHRGTAQSNELFAYELLGRSIAATLDSSEEPQDFLQRWPGDNDIQLSLQARSGFPIPAELTQEFFNGKPLILRSNNKFSLHFYMPTADQVLSLEFSQALVPGQSTSINLLLTILFYLGVVAAVLIWIFPLIRRLIKLQQMTQAFGVGDVSSRIEVSAMSYVADIEREFNRMADRIENLIADNKLLSRAVSHNLKTPLSRLRFGIDAIEETDDDEARQKYFRRINNDLEAMNQLIEILLQYARLDEANVKPDKQKLELNKLLQALIDDIGDQSITYRPACMAVHVATDANYLAILFNNLISNAIKYCNSTVDISLTAAENTVAITVEDDGDGISLSERDKVLKPFYRGSNNAEKSGHGMGLAIAARIAEWLGAELQISKSVRLGGCSATVLFSSRR